MLNNCFVYVILLCLSLKTFLLFRQKRGGDVQFPSVCYEYVLLPLVNREAALVYSRAEYSQTGRDVEREAESKRCRVAAEGEGHTKTYQ